MKKLKMVLLLTLFSVSVMSQVGQIQQIKIISFTVKNQLPAVIDNWNTIPGSLLLVAQMPPQVRVEGARLVLQIRANGAIICGNNASSGMPVDHFTTRSFSAQELSGMLSGCHDLKDGSYSICAQFYNIDRVAISNEICKEFTVETPKDIDYAPPTLITPDNGKLFSEAELQRPVMFRWTTPTPKPRETVTYRLRVWQLMQGQNGVQAMKANQPIVSKDVDNITQAVVNSILTGPCKPPYLCDFIWSVQAVNRDGKPLGRNDGTSEPWTFKVNQPGNEISAPVNVFPADKQSIGIEDAKNAITFKWKSVAPQQAGVTYKLRIWQLMQGQTGIQAIKSNPPIANLDVDGNGVTDALTDGIIRHLITGPCKPPYLCDFVWNVQAINKEGRPIGSNNGTSEATAFAVSQYIIQLDSIKVACTATPGVYTFSYAITNPNAGTAKLTNLVVTSSTPGGATITGFAPPLNTNIPSGNQLTITGTINGSPSLSNICIGAEITDLVNNFWKASKDTCVNVTPCKCDACSDKRTNIDIVPTNNIVINGNNTVTLNQPITITTTPPKLVKNIKAELVYFEFVPESEDCLPCNKDSKTFGNFDNGMLAAVTGLGAGTHSLEWNFSPPKNFSGGGNTAAMTITLPPTVGCCSATIRWCIRYVVTFEDCTVCNKLVCYEKKKEGCAKGNPIPNKDPK